MNTEDILLMLHSVFPEEVVRNMEPALKNVVYPNVLQFMTNQVGCHWDMEAAKIELRIIIQSLPAELQQSPMPNVVKAMFALMLNRSNWFPGISTTTCLSSAHPCETETNKKTKHITKNSMSRMMEKKMKSARYGRIRENRKRMTIVTGRGRIIFIQRDAKLYKGKGKK